MDRNDVIDFFNSHAAKWDEEMIRDDSIINTILDNAGVQEGSSVLDVACGTGVLIPDYLKRGARHVTGIDIADKMIDIARANHECDKVSFVCGDATVFHEGSYDCIVIYNAFPHFDDPRGLIANLTSLLKPHGRLTVAHGMSREKIDRHHSGSASKISVGLMEADQLAELFADHLTVTTVISDDRMYQVVGELM